jgi:hypothetical protein
MGMCKQGPGLCKDVGCGHKARLILTRNAGAEAWPKPTSSVIRQYQEKQAMVLHTASP